MRKALSGIVLAILALAFLVLTSGTSTADVAGLSMGRTGTNTVGSDTYWSRNDEYQDVTNTSSVPVDVGGLVLVDSWGKVNNPDGVGCNAYKVTSVPGGTDADGTGTGTYLQPGHTLRVYVGAGSPSFNGHTMHYVYMNSKKVCGYNGHFFNNLKETVWMGLNGVWESRSYNFEGGYYV